jgi:hypothetical protein
MISVTNGPDRKRAAGPDQTRDAMSTNRGSPSPQPLQNVLDEASRLMDIIEAVGLKARLLGGVGVQIAAQSAGHAAFTRTPQDVDVISERNPRPRIDEAFIVAGYRADDMFNVINGHRRLLYHDDSHERHVDVFVGHFEMCHAIPLHDRLDLYPRTLPPADLMLTKLQIYRLNPKDQLDILRLLSAFPVTSDDASGINALYIGDLLSKDWGLWRTATENLRRTRAAIAGDVAEAEVRQALESRLDQLESVIESRPRSLGWKARARIGDRVRWYQEPEEV